MRARHYNHIDHERLLSLLKTDMPYYAIAEEFGSTENSIKVTVCHLRKKLGKKMVPKRPPGPSAGGSYHLNKHEPKPITLGDFLEDKSTVRHSHSMPSPRSSADAGGADRDVVGA